MADASSVWWEYRLKSPPRISPMMIIDLLSKKLITISKKLLLTHFLTWVTQICTWVTHFFIRWHKNAVEWHKSQYWWHKKIAKCNIFLTFSPYLGRVICTLTQIPNSVTQKWGSVTQNRYWLTQNKPIVTQKVGWLTQRKWQLRPQWQKGAFLGIFAKILPKVRHTHL